MNLNNVVGSVIQTSKTLNVHLASAWSAGLSLLCLGIGLQGAVTPLLPASARAPIPFADETVMVEVFDPPAAAPAAEESPVEPEKEEEDIEIPPLLEITPPLTPPEMVELTPLEEVREPPPVPKPVTPEPKPKPVQKALPRPAARKPSTNANAGGGGNGSAPMEFNGNGKEGGRYPKPTYPSSALRAGQEGMVRLLVTVETSGMPSSIEVTASSGYAVLDRAARDTIQRRWRWPAGPARRYFTVPVYFNIKK